MSYLALVLLIVTIAVVVDAFSTCAAVPLTPSDALAQQLTSATAAGLV